MAEPQPKAKNNLSFQIEKFSAIVLELRHYADAHWDEFGARRELRVLSVDWSKYLAMDAREALVTATARRNGTLIGYLVMVIIPDLNAKAGKSANSVFYYTTPHPMRGLLLRGLIRCACRRILDSGIRYIRFGHRLKHNAGPILQSLGFVLDELSYSLDPDRFKG